MSAPDPNPEAGRLMTICNACRYCEGLCAVYPAMERRGTFAAGDLRYLANLCHACGACYAGCQFAPPHAFAVNVPRALAEVRAEAYARYAWPGALGALFGRNGLVVGAAAALGVAAFVLGFAAAADPAVLFAAGADTGAFYRVMPHEVMVMLFGAIFVYAVAAMILGVRRFHQDIGPPPAGNGAGPAILSAFADAARLRYLDGGGGGCLDADEGPPDRRRLYHHLTLYGFLLCLASTLAASAYHTLLGRVAPYGFFDLPVVLGLLGGIGLVVGPAGLLMAKRRHDPILRDPRTAGGEIAFSAMLIATGLSGLALLFLRESPAMGMLLAIHLGVVFALFLALPYGKFVHGLYRAAALYRYAREAQAREVR